LTVFFVVYLATLLYPDLHLDNYSKCTNISKYRSLNTGDTA